MNKKKKLVNLFGATELLSNKYKILDFSGCFFFFKETLKILLFK